MTKITLTQRIAEHESTIEYLRQQLRIATLENAKHNAFRSGLDYMKSIVMEAFKTEFRAR